MKARDRSLSYKILHRIQTAPAQSMVEFAMALPVLLLATFGVVEFGRLLQAWLALENGARFAVRYAVTGEFNPAYCDEADTALGLTTEDGNSDCKVEPALTATDQEKEDARDQTQALQDWARLPSIRDAAMGGASGISFDNAVSGNYIQYLSNAESHGNTFSANDRGDPSKPGYFSISTCSNRHVPAGVGSPVTENNQRFYISDSAISPKYYPGHTGQDDYLYYPSICQMYDPVAMYMDDAGGPGDRVRITLTFRHNMIMPFLSDWWPTLRLNTSRDGVVEKFRTSRVTGLSEGNMNPDTATPTSTFTPTFTASPTSTNTPTATSTSTFTVTPSKTATLIPCVTDGNGIRAEYYNFTGGVPPSNPFTSPINVSIIPYVDFGWGNGGPGNGVGDNMFAARYVGEVMALYTEKYTFYAAADDGVRLWVNGTSLVNKWIDQSETEYSGTINLTRCQKYPIILEFYENGGGAAVRLKWSSSSQTKEVIPQKVLFASMGTASTATITPTPTVTKTGTITLTPTVTLTPTRTFTRTLTLIPSLTYTRTLTPIPPTRTLTPIPPTVTRTPTSTSSRTSTNTPTETEIPSETPIPPTKTVTKTVPFVPSNTPSITPTRYGGG
jgi:hypothetical protein